MIEILLGASVVGALFLIGWVCAQNDTWLDWLLGISYGAILVLLVPFLLWIIGTLIRRGTGW